MEKNNIKLKTIKKLEITTIVFDIIGFLLFAVAMIGFMSAYQIGPVDGGEVLPPSGPLTGKMTIFGFLTMDAEYVNMFMTLAVVFASITIPIVVIGIKKYLNKENDDYNKWEAFNILMNGIVSLLTVNIFSLVIRLFNANLMLKYSEGQGYVGFSKTYLKLKKDKRNANKDKELLMKERMESNKITETNFKAEISKHRLDAKNSNIAYADYQPLVQANKEYNDWTNRTNLDLIDEEILLKKQTRQQGVGFLFKKTGTYVFLGIMALFIFIPFYWMIITALRPYNDIENQVITFLPSLKRMQWINFKYVFYEANIIRFIFNTLFVGVMSTIGTIITTILAAFAFSRLDFKGRDGIFALLLATMMVPGELFIMTNIITVSRGGFGWVTGGGSQKVFLALIVPFMTSVFYTFYLRQTFKQIPNSLYQAAKVDGSSDFKYLTRVMIPMASSTIVTIVILSVIGSWNAFVWPRQITGLAGDVGKNYYLVSNALQNLNFQPPGTSVMPMFNMTLAASALVTIPLLVVFLAFRDRIMAGVGRSGIKG